MDDSNKVSFCWKGWIVVEVFTGIGNGGPPPRVKEGEDISTGGKEDGIQAAAIILASAPHIRDAPPLSGLAGFRDHKDGANSPEMLGSFPKNS